MFLPFSWIYSDISKSLPNVFLVEIITCSIHFPPLSTPGAAPAMLQQHFIRRQPFVAAQHLARLQVAFGHEDSDGPTIGACGCHGICFQIGRYQW